jgi:tRNA A22 N-methylase
MTHAEKLRAYLLSAGFAIVGETLSREGERIYQTICAEPGGEGFTPPVLSPAELAVGEARFRVGDPTQKALYIALIDRALRTETNARDARRRAGQRTPEQDLLVVSLEALRNQIS